jgi:hypothetical protein
LRDRHRAVPSDRTAGLRATTSRAASGVESATRTRTISGPTIQTSSVAVASIANTGSGLPQSCKTADHIPRLHAATGGQVAPTSTAGGASTVTVTGVSVTRTMGTSRRRAVGRSGLARVVARTDHQAFPGRASTSHLNQKNVPLTKAASDERSVLGVNEQQQRQRHDPRGKRAMMEVTSAHRTVPREVSISSATILGSRRSAERSCY